MTLPCFTVFLEPANPLQFSLPEFRASLARELAEYQSSEHRPDYAGQVIHRYPAILCKQVRNDLMVMGICQGAGFLRQLAGKSTEMMPGKNSCIITSRDPEIRGEVFGITGQIYDYEILTPWLALNQQNAKKFYDLKGKPARDAFMQKILLAHLNTIAKSLDSVPDEPVTCTAHVRFIRERIHQENMIVFLGKFTTNLCIPDYLGIGHLVSQGYGTIRKIPATDESHQHNRPSP
jgi:hypothetical protein